jgi:Transposase DDE domain
MGYLEASYQTILGEVQEHLPQLRPAQQRGLAEWVTGTLLAGVACEARVLGALTATRRAWEAARRRLRAWLYDGADRPAPCDTQVDVQACFGPLLRWVLHWWQGDALPLALDATLDRTRHAAIVVSVLYRGSAIPVGWMVLPANTPGAWLEPLWPSLEALAAAMPPSVRPVLFADRGLWSPRLWQWCRAHGWAAVLRIQADHHFTPHGQHGRPAAQWLPGPGHAWVGAGIAFTRERRLPATLVAVWAAGQTEPWVLLTTLPPRQVGVLWYGLRMWIEHGFRALKSVGWEWERTRRTDPARVARYWLVLAVATLWTVAVGTRAEEAWAREQAPGALRWPPLTPTPRVRRSLSVFQRGLQAVRTQVARGRLWRGLWLLPDPWPTPPPDLRITYHDGLLAPNGANTSPC